MILKQEVPSPKVEPLRIKIDPGAKTTGLALVNDATGEVVWVAELQHRGFQIRDALTSRRQLRRSRRNRKTRYWDAACVGASTPEQLITSGVKPLLIAAKGHGTCQQCRTDKFLILVISQTSVTSVTQSVATQLSIFFLILHS